MQPPFDALRDEPEGVLIRQTWHSTPFWMTPGFPLAYWHPTPALIDEQTNRE